MRRSEKVLVGKAGGLFRRERQESVLSRGKDPEDIEGRMCGSHHWKCRLWTSQSPDPFNPFTLSPMYHQGSMEHGCSFTVTVVRFLSECNPRSSQRAAGPRAELGVTRRLVLWAPPQAQPVRVRSASLSTESRRLPRAAQVPASWSLCVKGAVFFLLWLLAAPTAVHPRAAPLLPLFYLLQNTGPRPARGIFLPLKKKKSSHVDVFLLIL